MKKVLVRDKIGQERQLKSCSPKEYKELLLQELSALLSEAVAQTGSIRYQNIAEATERFNMLITSLIPVGKAIKTYEEIQMYGKSQALNGGFFGKYYEEKECH